MTTAPELLAKIDALPEAPRARTLTALQKAAPWAGDLVGVDVSENADGWQVTLHFTGAAFDVFTPHART